MLQLLSSIRNDYPQNTSMLQEFSRQTEGGTLLGTSYFSSILFSLGISISRVFRVLFCHTGCCFSILPLQTSYSNSLSCAASPAQHDGFSFPQPNYDTASAGSAGSLPLEAGGQHAILQRSIRGRGGREEKLVSNSLPACSQQAGGRLRSSPQAF